MLIAGLDLCCPSTNAGLLAALQSMVHSTEGCARTPLRQNFVHNFDS